MFCKILAAQQRSENVKSDSRNHEPSLKEKIVYLREVTMHRHIVEQEYQTVFFEVLMMLVEQSE
jgi:hypothetical protein